MWVSFAVLAICSRLDNGIDGYVRSLGRWHRVGLDMGGVQSIRKARLRRQTIRSLRTQKLMMIRSPDNGKILGHLSNPLNGFTAAEEIMDCPTAAVPMIIIVEKTVGN